MDTVGCTCVGAPITNRPTRAIAANSTPPGYFNLPVSPAAFRGRCSGVRPWTLNCVFAAAPAADASAAHAPQGPNGDFEHRGRRDGTIVRAARDAGVCTTKCETRDTQPLRTGVQYAVCVAGSWDVETRRRSAPNCRQVERAAVHIESRRSLMVDERGCRGLRGWGRRRAAATCSCFT